MLGVCLLEGRPAVGRVRGILMPSDFYTEAHRCIYAAICELDDARHPVDLITLNDALRRRGDLELVGGPALLAMLVEDASIMAHLDAYVDLVREHAAYRETIEAGTAAVRAAFEAQDGAAQVIAIAETRLRELRIRLETTEAAGTVARSLKEVLGATAAQLEGMTASAEVIPTSIPGLNALLDGGIRCGEDVFLAARPSLGKTALALQWVVTAARHGFGSLVVSREMVLTALGRRLLAQTSQIPNSALRSRALDADDWARLVTAMAKLADLPVWFTEKVASVAQVDALTRLMVERHGIQLLVVDYLQLLRAPRGMTDPRVAIEYVSQALKALTTELGIAVLCLSSLSRTRDDRGKPRRPTLYDLRNSGELEHDADIVMFLHADEPGTTTKTDDLVVGWDPVDLIVAKARDGRKATINLLYAGSILTFEEKSDRVSGDDEPPVPF